MKCVPRPIPMAIIEARADERYIDRILNRFPLDWRIGPKRLFTLDVRNDSDERKALNLKLYVRQAKKGEGR